MKSLLIFSAALFLAGALLSCSGGGSILKDNRIALSYSSGGGFSGLIKGITIDSSGTASIWEKTGTQNEVIKNTFKLGDDILDNIVTAMSDSTIYNYHLNQTANMTTRLLIKFNGLSNDISFDSFSPPADMPAALSRIMQELKSILKNSKG